MSDPLRVTRSDDRPPSPPSLAPNRQLSAKAGVLQRLVAPLGFGFTARQAGAQDPHSGRHHVRGNTGELRNTTSREENAAYRTGIPISAIDISPHKTHAILAGREILKTIKVDDGKVTEDFDLRSALGSYASTRRTIGNRDFLPATDVKWSHKEHDTKIATAASNGRIVIYDLTKPEVELLRVHEHDRQVHKLAFNPFSAAKLLSGSQDGTLRLWDLRLFDGERDAVSMKSQSTFYGHADSVRDVRWSTGDGFEFAFCTDSGSVQLWDFRNPSAPKMRINAHDKACYALDWHPDGRHVATAGLDKHVKIWDLAKLDRRQKPLWVVRTPQAIMNLRWRPACWTWEMQESGDWQCTQLATSYNQEDSRVHVWDLRRPHIPFREITRAGRGPPSDLLWHSKDLLWSVGEDGNFQQTDTKYAPQVLDQLNPCQISFTPDGGFVKFSEKGAPRRSFGWQEASDGFLNQRPGHELTAKSRSWDEDDTNNEGYMAANFRRRAHKAASRYPKSQGNTPPSRDERMELVPLEKSVRKSGSYKNRQLGLMQEITGASLNDEAFHFLALNYAQPLTEEERRQSPESILGRLEAAFLQNAEVCGEVAMYRLAQTWRIIGAVLIPELTAWAEMNRRNRLSRGSCVNHAENNDQLSKGSNEILSQDQGTISNYNVEDDQPTKFKQHVFKGVFESTVKQESIDEPSSSNITTPIAGPVGGSSLISHNRSRWNLPEDEEVESIPPLPESILTSHQTAAAAADALRASPPSTPVSETDFPQNFLVGEDDPGSVSPKTGSHDSYEPERSSPQAILHSPNWRKSRGAHERDRRAALKDYKVQTRPVLTFDNEPGLNRPPVPARHDSNESFAMFSTSTTSSHRTKSIGRSVESPHVASMRSFPDSWRRRDVSRSDSMGRPSLPSDESARHNQLGDMLEESDGHDCQGGSDLSDFGVGGLGGLSDGNEVSDHSQSNMQDRHDRASQEDSSFGRPTGDTLPFEFEPSSSPVQHDYQVNHPPIPSHRSKFPNKKVKDIATEVDTSSTEFIYQDFRPLKVSDSEGKYLLGWDAISLVAAVIEFDLTASHDMSTCQLTTHLLMHISPYFDAFAPSDQVSSTSSPTGNIASRLKVRPHARRIAESAFATYLQFLLNHELYSQAAEVKAFAHDAFYSIDDREGPSLKQELRILLTCGHCGAPLGGQNVGLLCSECLHAREPCPICLMADVPSQARICSSIDDNHPSMWTSCIGCGHGGHVSCLAEWLADSESEGACPTPGCWHDCGPGRVRDERIELQKSKWIQESTSKASHHSQKGGSGATHQTGSSTATKRDSWIVNPSPAVSRARKSLRDPSAGKKQVRLLAPGEPRRTGSGSGTGSGGGGSASTKLSSTP